MRAKKLDTYFKNLYVISVLEIVFELYPVVNLVRNAENKDFSWISKVMTETRLKSGKNDANIVFFG